MSSLEKLQTIKKQTGKKLTVGLSDHEIQPFLASDQKLNQAIDEAFENFEKIKKEFPELMQLDEKELCQKVQSGYLNFYPEDQTNPYLPLAARGPWIVTFFGSVIHDSGGYGMMGFGHNPGEILCTLAKTQVMANIMTPSLAQYRFDQKLRKEIGHRRVGNKTPFSKFICMNSGSEAVNVACRISDIHAKTMTDPEGRHHGKKLMYLTLKGSFHGRTEKPAQLSDSSRKKYEANLASFRGLENNFTVVPNDISQLQEAFHWADKHQVYFESFFIEPVMGEGNPGLSITPEFYQTARELTEKNGTLFIVDSIQAGLRAHGCLSICDYPGFEKLLPPDMETYSKALNGGQFPFSVLALTEKAAQIYVKGVYGNTKTANPRALDVASTVLDLVTPTLRKNVQEKGQEFLQQFNKLQKKYPDIITGQQGTGLLFSLDLNPKKFKVVGFGGIEEWLRIHGLGVIHGGENSLRFTPHFGITESEIMLMIHKLDEALQKCPKVS